MIPPSEILVVEDGPSDVPLTREALRRARLSNTPHVVNRGEEALAFLYGAEGQDLAPRPDLVLPDINLPGISGLETVTLPPALDD